MFSKVRAIRRLVNVRLSSSLRPRTLKIPPRLARWLELSIKSLNKRLSSRRWYQIAYKRTLLLTIFANFPRLSESRLKKLLILSASRSRIVSLWLLGSGLLLSLRLNTNFSKGQPSDGAQRQQLNNFITHYKRTLQDV